MPTFHIVEWSKTFKFPRLLPGDMMICPNTRWLATDDLDNVDDNTPVFNLKFKPVIVIAVGNETVEFEETFIEYTIYSISGGILRARQRV